MTLSIRDYYDRNTNRFLRFGGGKRVGAIHRKLWAPGVNTGEQALLYINRWIAGELFPSRLASDGSKRWLDVGCGVGGTATYLAEHLDAHVTGITISAKQAAIARSRARQAGLLDFCSFIAADFHALPARVEFDGAYAIEAFAHSRHPDRFFEQISKLLKPGGKAIIVDDVLAELPSQDNASNQRGIWTERFRMGWRLHALLKPARIVEAAEKAGLNLIAQQDFSTFIKPLSKRMETIFRWVALLPLPGAYWQSLRGGMALQICLAHGWVRYQGLVFEKQDHPQSAY